MGLAVESRTEGRRPDMAVVKNDHLLTPSEVAGLFRVNPRTVTRWAKAGKLPSIRTLGGDRRAVARLKKDRRDLDRRHADVLKKAAFREDIPQSAWLEAMLKCEIEAAR
jgi:excisionase family DNA binding protein